MTQYANIGDSMLPTGLNAIPGIDPNWITSPKLTAQTVSVTQEDDSVDQITVYPGSQLRAYRIMDSRPYQTIPSPATNDWTPITEMEIAVNAGETVFFEALVSMGGASGANCSIVVLTPKGPSGGFQVNGLSKLETFKGGSYGADDFNNPAGVIHAGLAGEALSYVIARVRGVLAVGSQPGLLQLALGPATEGFAVPFAAFVDPDLIWTYWTQPDQWVSGVAGTVVDAYPPTKFGNVWVQVLHNGDTFDRTPDKAVTNEVITLPDSGLGGTGTTMAFDGDGRLWAGGASFGKIWYSDNLGDTWTESYDGAMTTPDGDLDPTNGGIAVSEDGQRIAMTADATGREYLIISTNGGGTWDAVKVEEVAGKPAGLTPFFTQNGVVVVDAVYPTYNIRRSTDYSTFTTVYTSPDAPFNEDAGMQCMLEDGTLVFLTVNASGDYGILRSVNEGLNWNFLSFDPNLSFQYRIQSHGNDVYIFKYFGTEAYVLPNAGTAAIGTLTQLADQPS